MLDPDVSSTKNRGVNSKTDFLLESLNNLPKYLESFLKHHVENCFPSGTLTFLDYDAYKLSIQEFNSIFNFPRDSSEESSKESPFNENFPKLIARLQSIDLIKCTIFRTYPLLRNILIVVEAHVLYTFRGLKHRKFTSKFYKFLVDNDRFCYVVDSFYRESRIRVLSHDVIKGFNYGSLLLDTSLRALELVCNTLLPNNKLHESGSTSEHDLLVFFMIFNYMQRVLAQFLVLLILQDNQNDKHKTSKSDTMGYKSWLHALDVKNRKILTLSSSGLKAPKYIRENKFINKWSLYFFTPIYHVLSAGFSSIIELKTINNCLLEALVDSLNNFTPLLWMESTKVLSSLENLIVLHSIHLFRLNEVVSDHLTTLYNQIIATIVSRKNSGSIRPTSSIDKLSSRELSSYFQLNYVTVALSEYSKFLEILMNLNLNFLNRLKNEKNISLFYSSIPPFSRFISNVVRLILLADGMDYLTGRMRNSEMQFLLKFNVDKLWELTSSILRVFPFKAVTALFYYLGSQFNKENVLSQIYVFNSIDHSLLNAEEYLNYTKMLDYVLFNSKHLFVNPVSLENATSNSKHLKYKYLSIKFSDICKMLVNELASDTDNRAGVVDLFSSWCYSINVYHNLLSRQICYFIVRLINAKTVYMYISKHILDIVLGLCFFTHFDKLTVNYVYPPCETNRAYYEDEVEDESEDDEQEEDDYEDYGNDDYMIKVRPKQLHAFRYIKILSTSPFLLVWMMENVTVPYTCVFVSSMRSLLKGLHDPCSCVICTFKCYFHEKLGKSCFCYDSLIVNRSPSISHYIEFLHSISPSLEVGVNEPDVKTDVNGSDQQKSDTTENEKTEDKSASFKLELDEKLKSLSDFLIKTVNGVLVELISVLDNLGDTGDLKLKLTIFKIATKLTAASVNFGTPESEDINIPGLIKLFYILAGPQLKKISEFKKTRLFAKLLNILNNILTRNDNEELIKLHKRMVDVLVKKLDKYPLVLLPLGVDIRINEILVKDYSDVIPLILDSVTQMDPDTARIIYSYYVWKVARNPNCVVKNRDFIRKSPIMNADKYYELPVIVNVFFLLSHKIQDASSSED